MSRGRQWSPEEDGTTSKSGAVRPQLDGNCIHELQRKTSSVHGRAVGIKARVSSRSQITRRPVEKKICEGEVTQNRSLLLGVSIGLFVALAVLTARYVAGVLAG